MPAGALPGGPAEFGAVGKKVMAPADGHDSHAGKPAAVLETVDGAREVFTATTVMVAITTRAHASRIPARRVILDLSFTNPSLFIALLIYVKPLRATK
jgi:hypothetical protein